MKEFSLHSASMTLTVLLPYRIFAEIADVTRVVSETDLGSFGFLPQRLDCVAALVPGILTYETENGKVHYLAVDEGVLLKAGTQITVSVRNAVGGADLGKLHETVKKEFKELDESERKIRSVMAKMERGFIYSLEKFHKD